METNDPYRGYLINVVVSEQLFQSLSKFLDQRCPLRRQKGIETALAPQIQIPLQNTD